MNYSVDWDGPGERDRETDKQPCDPAYSEMDDPAMLEACGDDGMAWAKAFCQIKAKMGWTLADIDEGLMVSWFANAIERSWQKRVERAEPSTRPLLKEATRAVGPDMSTPEGRKKASDNARWYRENLKPFA